MQLSRHIAAVMAATACFATSAQQPEQWLHVYRTEGKEFTSLPMEKIHQVTFVTAADGSITQLKAGGMGLYLDGIDSWHIGPNVPRLNITTDVPVGEIESKETYLDATLELDGMGVTPDVASPIKIRGRGNSTWSYAKKPYRLKFETKTSLWGYKKAKNYCLLANFLDASMMKNLAAATAAQLLDVAGAFHAAPVDVWLNGNYKGSYMLTEKMGFNAGCLDMTKEQEAKSVLFELDTYLGEETEFISPAYGLPVIVKEPDLPADPAEADAWVEKWTADFLDMEQAVAQGADLSQWIDYESLARYLIVFNLTCNQEINHPKSIYLHKTEGGLYKFGPAWDFDWAFGYDQTYQSVINVDDPRKLHDEAVAYLKENTPFTENEWYMLPDGTWVMVYYGDIYVFDGGRMHPYPGEGARRGPSYQAPLFGTGKNSHTQAGKQPFGFGGEFFLNIVAGNNKFMSVYSRIWREFYAEHLGEFWDTFNAYERALRPSAARNGTIWGNGQNLTGDVDALRKWIENRIEYINNPANNYGLYQ